MRNDKELKSLEGCGRVLISEARLALLAVNE